MNTITFRELLTLFNNYQGKYYPELLTQNTTYYFTALLGEAGELANIYKKLIRHKLGIRKENQPTKPEEFKAMIIQEYSGALKYMAIVGAKLAKELNMTEHEFTQSVMLEFSLSISEKEHCTIEKANQIIHKLKTN